MHYLRNTCTSGNAWHAWHGIHPSMGMVLPSLEEHASLLTEYIPN